MLHEIIVGLLFLVIIYFLFKSFLSGEQKRKQILKKVSKLWQKGSKKGAQVADRLFSDKELQRTIVSRIMRWIKFRTGFSECRYCVYCDIEQQESTQGWCRLSDQTASVTLSQQDLKATHRCPAFSAVLYNFKGIAIGKRDMEKIHTRKLELVVTWLGWFVAVLLAYLSSGGGG